MYDILFLIILYRCNRYSHLDDEDFCRVRLPKKTHDQSDYINASIIRLIPPV